MTNNRRETDIRRAKKEALYFKELSTLFLQVAVDTPSLDGIHISSIQLSPDKSVCNVLFFSENGSDDFNKRLPNLILYKPSMRRALSQSISSRYTPDLVFKYDKQMEKQNKLETLFNKLKVEGKL